ncbi:MAG: flavin reductase family protein, partial [Anaerovibrio sp.]|nr:flavin reductase family protein [Anaerovibrio sp.]
MSFKEIAPEELQENAFKVIGKDWLLVTGTAEGKSNAMTASWGGMGVMWGKPVAFLVIRPQRYTKEFI